MGQQAGKDGLRAPCKGDGYDPGVQFGPNNKPKRMSVDRRLFPTEARHAPLRRLLLAQDGSTTRLCEALIDSHVTVLLHHQQRTSSVPDGVRTLLGGDAWLERVTSLCAPDGRVLMDNLSFTRLDAVPDWFLQGLDQGKAPIGHLLDKIFVRREPVQTDAPLQALLWNVVGQPDAHTSRSYRIVTPTSPLMLIFEVFRDGMVRED
jgi:chorismate-pyruvate lyase